MSIACRPEAKGAREQGRVCSVKDSFGFVRCVDRPGDLFFHLTEAPPNLVVGDEVDFFVGTGGRCGLRSSVSPPIGMLCSGDPALGVRSSERWNVFQTSIEMRCSCDTASRVAM